MTASALLSAASTAAKGLSAKSNGLSAKAKSSGSFKRYINMRKRTAKKQKMKKTKDPKLPSGREGVSDTDMGMEEWKKRNKIKTKGKTYINSKLRKKGGGSGKNLKRLRNKARRRG